MRSLNEISILLSRIYSFRLTQENFGTEQKFNYIKKLSFTKPKYQSIFEDKIFNSTKNIQDIKAYNILNQTLIWNNFNELRKDIENAKDDNEPIYYQFSHPILKKNPLSEEEIKFYLNEKKFSYINVPKVNIYRQNFRYLNKLNKKYDELYKEKLKEYENASRIFNNAKKQDLKKFDDFVSNYKLDNPESIVERVYFIRKLSPFLSVFKKKFEVEYEPKAKILIISAELPDVNRLTFYKIQKKYNKKRYSELKKPLGKIEHKKISEFILYSIPIRIIYEIAKYDKLKAFKAIGFNGWVKQINSSTGLREVNNILSLLVKYDEIKKIKIKRINPKECFNKFKGTSAAKIYENIPVKPILTFSKDSRIIQSKDILDNLEEENLAIMEWDDFEHLIRELFAKEFSQEGVEVKITQASRDRGVDAIAYDPDPIRGGKFVIQAKRYTAVVEVSAVRDLYGTILNEGANRGILVTTAKYGAEAYNFAKDKNITLIDGSKLLGLLEKHGYKFKIDIREARKILNLTPKKTY